MRLKNELTEKERKKRLTDILKNRLTEKERKKRLTEKLQNTEKEPKRHNHPASRYPFLLNGERWDPVQFQKDEKIFQKRLDTIRKRYQR